MSVSSTHRSSKNVAYWHNLVSGDTSVYKKQVIEGLLAEHFRTQCDSILDIGCGTCEIAMEYRDRLQAMGLTCLDYDAKVIECLKQKYPDPKIRWLVKDLFDLGGSEEKYDLIFLLDMLHEVYSFYGRPNQDPTSPVDDRLGLRHVREALRNVAAATAPQGGIVITDDVLTEGDPLLRVRIRRGAIQDAVDRFLAGYPSKRLQCRFVSDDMIELPAREFCTLLTQYNKLSQDRPDRWNIERMEVHQYMSLSEFTALFEELGFRVRAEVGTPEPSYQEWVNDFEIVEGMDGFPHKRITLLAIKRE